MQYHNLKTVAYKTVEMFSGITKKRLWLKDSKNLLNSGTDGHEIKVPFSDPEFYRLVEEQLAHILFRSDAKAKAAFVKEYTGKVSQVSLKMGVEVQEKRLEEALNHLITVLEKRRVLSLWEVLYPGSSKLLCELHQHDIQPLLSHAHENLLNFCTCVCIHPAAVEPGALDKFRPYIEEALKKVHKRGFGATLSVSKWLVMQLVNQLIRDMKDLSPPPPPPSPPSKMSKDTTEEAGDKAEEPNEGGSDQDGNSGSQGAPGNEGESGDDPEDQNEEEDAGGDSEDEEEEEEEREEPWNPPSPDATGQERTRALKELIDKMGAPPNEPKDSVEESRFQRGRQSPKAQALASQALSANVGDPDKFEKALEDSEQEMSELLDQVREQMRQKINHDDWLQKDAMARVEFVDHKPTVVAPPLDHEDSETVQRLRALFYRVMGKRRAMLEDYGSEIDVLAFIERKMTGVPAPVFRADGMGRGFRAHILLDRSSSMAGSKTHQCARACRIIQRALRFPFVQVVVWGFSSFENGGITLTRYDSGKEVVISDRDRGSGGTTPLHVAVRLAVRELQEGTESKQLFAITDGFPTHTRRDGKQFSTEQLLMFTRGEVRKARSRGINVTGVMLGQRDDGRPVWFGQGGESENGVYYDLKAKDLAFMFGSRRNWRRMHPERIGRGLVELVATSFVDFLRHR